MYFRQAGLSNARGCGSCPSCCQNKIWLPGWTWPGFGVPLRRVRILSSYIERPNEWDAQKKSQWWKYRAAKEGRRLGSTSEKKMMEWLCASLLYVHFFNTRFLKIEIPFDDDRMVTTIIIQHNDFTILITTIDGDRDVTCKRSTLDNFYFIERT